MYKVISIILISLFFSCSEEKLIDQNLIKGLWVLDSSLSIIPNKVYSEVSIGPTSSNRKIFAISEDRYYSYLKKSEYFVENDSTFYDYYLNTGSNYYIVQDTLKVHNTRIITNNMNEMILFENDYSVKYQILKLDSLSMKLKYFDVIHFYSLMNRDVKVESKRELLDFIKMQ